MVKSLVLVIFFDKISDIFMNLSVCLSIQEEERLSLGQKLGEDNKTMEIEGYLNNYLPSDCEYLDLYGRCILKEPTIE
jgi:hypothetical protein